MAAEREHEQTGEKQEQQHQQYSRLYEMSEESRVRPLLVDQKLIQHRNRQNRLRILNRLIVSADENAERHDHRQE